MLRRCLLAALLAAIFTGDAFAQWYRSPYNLSSAPALYRSSDRITSVHECTHGVNSMLRQRFGGECYYIADGKFVRFPSIGIRLEAVRQRCKYRGMSFDLYLVQQQRYWGSNALYLFDEWSAYANGAAVAVYRRVAGQNWSEVLQACEFGYYTYELLQLVPDSYPQKRQLELFWRWHAKRCVEIADTAERTGVNYRPNIRPWREWLRARLKG